MGRSHRVKWFRNAAAVIFLLIAESCMEVPAQYPRPADVELFRYPLHMSPSFDDNLEQLMSPQLRRQAAAGTGLQKSMTQTMTYIFILYETKEAAGYTIFNEKVAKAIKKIEGMATEHKDFPTWCQMSGPNFFYSAFECRKVDASPLRILYPSVREHADRFPGRKVHASDTNAGTRMGRNSTRPRPRWWSRSSKSLR